MANLYSAVTYTSDGVTTEFDITFEYLSRDDIFVYHQPAVPADEPWTILLTSDWEFVSDNRIRITGISPLAGDKVVIRRFTQRSSRLADYHNGAILTEQDLNIVTLQLLYICQEILDLEIAGGSPDIELPGGPGDPGDTDLDLDGIVQTVIDELLNSQLFQDLIALIDLIDINAESIIGNILNTHQTWGLGRIRDNEIADANALIDTAFGTLGAQDARIVTIESAYVNADEALAIRIDGLQVSFDTFANNTDASILNIQTAIASGDAALAQQILDINATLGNAISDNAARLTTIESVNVTQDSAIAQLVTEVNARVELSGLESLLIASSHISGIKATADANEATVQTIESSLATVITDTANNTGNLAALQIVSDATATEASANSTWRQSLATAYGLPFNEGGAETAAAIESRWQSYADSESAAATAIFSIQANTVPILFRATVPDQSESPFGDPPQWPDGTMWYNTAELTRAYFWDSDATVATVNSGGHTYFVGPVLTGGMGYWLSARDEDLNQSLGALVQTTYESIVDPTTGEVRASLTNTLQAVLGDQISAVDDSLQAYIDPTTGIMNSQWTLRLNQYSGPGQAYIAGVGLGLQSDPNNPEAGATSRFIVMADLFGIVAPPSGNDLTGVINSNTVKVPFIVDSNTGLVGIDGNVVVTGTLSAYTGAMDTVYMQRMIATDLTTGAYGLEPVSASGTRLEIASDSYWTGTDGRKYLIWAGSGSKNANNATFYVDTQGNAFFDGEVSADNITGSLNDLSPFNGSGGTTVGSGYTTIASETLPARTRPRDGMASVSFNLFGAGADQASARLRMRHDTGGGAWTAWTTVAEGTYDTPSAVPVTLSGSKGMNTANSIQATLEVKTNAGNQHSVNSIGGFLLGVR